MKNALDRPAQKKSEYQKNLVSHLDLTFDRHDVALWINDYSAFSAL